MDVPFVAAHEDTHVVPEEVPDGVDVWCPECDQRMRPRGPFSDGTARHFYHLDATNCPGGESEIHRKWKSLAVSGLRQRFNGKIEKCGPEIPLETSSTLTGSQTRRADAFLSFTDENPFFGKGVIVEVQHQNLSKDVEGVTHDYLTLGYSVYWAASGDFSNDRFLVDNMDAAFDERKDEAFAPYYSYPPCGIEQSRVDGGLLNYVLTESPESVIAFSDPVPECDHDWVTRMVQFCHRCGLSKYTGHSIASPIYEFEPANIRPQERPRTIRGEPPSDHTHQWEGLCSFPDGEILECDCGAKRTHTEGEVIIDHGPDATWSVAMSDVIFKDEESMSEHGSPRIANLSPSEFDASSP